MPDGRFLRVILFSGLVFMLLTPVFTAAGSDDKIHAPSGKGPLPALESLDAAGRMQLSKEDRCPVCGMFPAKHPKSAAAMVLNDGRTFYFCGNGCLLRTWRHSQRHLNVPADAIQRMVVRDYFRGEPLEAKDAWWVAGSDVIGPMGPALVALRSEKEMARFKERHGGRTIFRLSHIDDALWEKLFPPKHK